MVHRTAAVLAFKRWLSLLFWMAAIFFMSNQPSEVLPVYGSWDWLIKKGAHFLAYALLAVLAFRVTRDGPRRTSMPFSLPPSMLSAMKSTNCL